MIALASRTCGLVLLTASCLALACDDGAQSASVAPAKPGAAKSDPAKPNPGDTQPARSLRGSSCSGFRFVLGAPTSSSTSQPNADDPVADVDTTHALTLEYSCGDKTEKLALGNVELECHGASCGCSFVLEDGRATPDVEDDCDIEVGLDDFAPLRSKAPAGAQASWAVLTAVERAFVASIDLFHVVATDQGFDIVRQTYASGEAQPQTVLGSIATPS